jgi:hypothetical protein
MAVMLVAAPAIGQMIYGSPASAEVGFVMTSWTLEQDGQEVTVEQSVIPVTGFVPLRENTDVQYFLTYSESQATLDDGDHRLLGFSDLRVQINQSLVRDRIVLGLGVNLPTGKTNLDLGDEWLVMHYLSQDFLTVPLRRLGEGLGVSALVGGALDWRSVLLGATVAYQYAGAYTSYEGVGEYDPGEQINLTLRAETTAEAYKIWSGFTFADYTADKVDGVKTYDQNWYARTSLGLERRWSGFSLVTQASYLARDRSTTYDPVGAALNNLRLYGNEVVWRTNASLQGGRVGRTWSAGPVAEFRWIEANEFDAGNAAIQAYGLDGTVPLSTRLQAGVGFRVYTGEADGGGIALQGYQASLMVSGVM